MRVPVSHPDRRHRLAVAGSEITIDLAAGGRIADWHVDGLALLRDHGPHPAEIGMYPMAPWAGRVRGNCVDFAGAGAALPVNFHEWAIHGTVFTSSVRVIDASTDPAGARLVVRADSSGAWPWPEQVDLSFDLTEQGLSTTITVRALDGPFPAVVGWHPWFARRLARGGDARWSVSAARRAVRGVDYLPTGELVAHAADGVLVDDAFHVADRRIVVTWPGALELVISNGSPWFVVFDQLPASVCIEPQSGPPDGLRDTPLAAARIVTPDNPLRLVTRWTPRVLPEDPA